MVFHRNGWKPRILWISVCTCWCQQQRCMSCWEIREEVGKSRLTHHAVTCMKCRDWQRRERERERTKRVKTRERDKQQVVFAFFFLFLMVQVFLRFRVYSFHHSACCWEQIFPSYFLFVKQKHVRFYTALKSERQKKKGSWDEQALWSLVREFQGFVKEMSELK